MVDKTKSITSRGLKPKNKSTDSHSQMINSTYTTSQHRKLGIPNAKPKTANLSKNKQIEKVMSHAGLVSQN